MQRSDIYQTEAECFRENSMTSKDDVLNQLSLLRIQFKCKSETDREHSASFYNTLEDMLERMKKKVKQTHLFQELEDWWCYIITISSSGIKVNLQLCSEESFDEKGEFEPFLIIEEFELIRVDSKMLTVDEYAQLYLVDQGTVRQWIRRGKLRSAVKHGSEWRIPELSEPNFRGYKFGQYEIRGYIDGLPDKYSFIKAGAIVNFEQCAEDKKLYKISFSGIKHEAIYCETKEREKLELILIASPDAVYISDVFGNYS